MPTSTLVSVPANTKAAVVHSNNFDFFRLLFATFVIITHSYALLGLPEIDVLVQLTGVSLSGGIAVPGFLVLSGMLITKSLMRSNSLLDYFFKRAIRILPGLWVVLGVMAIVCFFISGKDAAAYFTHFSVKDYVLYGALLKMQYIIDGVFQQNPMKLINGSIWTIPYEVCFYAVLSLTWLIRKNTRAMLFVLVAVFVGLLATNLILFPTIPTNEAVVGFWDLRPSQVVHFALYFFHGAIWALIPLPSERMRNVLGWSAFLLFFALVVLVPGTGRASYLLLPVFVVLIGSLRYPIISDLRKLGDISYGVYLWGWPVQQLVIYFLHPSYLQLVLLAITGAYVLGYLSWKLVEARALRLKLK